MKVLVIGGGGREHAIVHALKKSPKVDHIWLRLQRHSGRIW